MIVLVISIIVFNLIAFKANKRLTGNQIAHIWMFTIACQLSFDAYVDFKYHGYWYFTKTVNWRELPATTVLVPPVNMMFLNWYPFSKDTLTKIVYVIFWCIGILLYEVIAMLPEPWSYFNYGWWKLWHSAIIDPILFFILLKYFLWICKLEKQVVNRGK